jgi:hypothetical protein
MTIVQERSRGHSKSPHAGGPPPTPCPPPTPKPPLGKLHK